MTKMIIAQMLKTMQIFVPGQKYKDQHKNIGVIMVKPILTCTAINMGTVNYINRGYYTAARRYEFYVRLARTDIVLPTRT